MKKLLHVGCGYAGNTSNIKGFNKNEWQQISLDIDPKVNPDIVASITDMSAVESESIDAIYSSHNIEHLYWHELDLAFKEFIRVLKNNGFILITCPNIQAICSLIADDKLLETCYESPAGPISPIDVLFGHRAFTKNNIHMAHHTCFTEKSLRKTILDNGFATVASMSRENPYFDLFALATKTAAYEDEIKKMAIQFFPLI